MKQTKSRAFKNGGTPAQAGIHFAVQRINMDSTAQERRQISSA
jgi:hypothetical protein